MGNTKDDEATVSAAIDNLKEIKAGGDPRAEQFRPDPDMDPLTVAQEEVDRLFEEHDLDDHIPRERVHVAIARWSRKNGTFKYNKRLPRIDRQRRFNRKMTGLVQAVGSHVIAANARILDEENDREAFIDTARHELAHVIAYIDASHTPHGISPGHGKGWKKWARRLGADLKSTHHKKSNTANYWYGCPRGHWKSSRVRRSKKIKHPGRYVCSQCEEKCVSWRDGEQRPTEPGVRFDGHEWREY